jgi:ATP-binding cassette subfamily F protein 3
VTIQNLVHSYDDKILFLDAELLVERGDRIAFLGPNGAGKSTLLRLIMGMETPSEGIAEIGKHNVIPGYFEQNQAEALDLNKTVLDTIHDEVPEWKNEDVFYLVEKQFSKKLNP